MAQRTLAQLQSYVLNRLGYTRNQDSDLDARITQWINEGLEDLFEGAEEAPWAILTTTAAISSGVNELTLSSAAMKIEQNALFVRDASNKQTRIKMVPRSKGLGHRPFRGDASAPTGRPLWLWVDGFDGTSNAWKIDVDPKPDRDYTLEYSYYRRAPNLSASGDVIEGPEELEKVALEYATWQAMCDAYGGDYSETMKSEAEYRRRDARFRQLFRLGDYEAPHFAPPSDLRQGWTDSLGTDSGAGTSDPLGG